MFEQIGKFTVSEKIGEGGFGTIFKGVDPIIKRPVAIKTCNSEDTETRARFTREAQIAGNLHHRHIVTIYDFGVQEGVPYLVQEYLSGEDLDHKIRRGDDISFDEKVLYLLQIARGLHYAHQNGVIHRDIKPGNVRVLEDGTAKILDFGIAKLSNQQTALTRTGTTLGTAAYLAPEQIKDEPVDHRTDIFSFGVMSYELLTYRRPFVGKTMSHVLYRILNEDAPRVSDAIPDCPAELDELVARCLAKDPADRFPDCGELETALGEILGDLRGTPTGPIVTSTEDIATAEIELDPRPPAPADPADIGDFELHGTSASRAVPPGFHQGATRRHRSFRWGPWVAVVALLVAGLGSLQMLGRGGQLPSWLSWSDLTSGFIESPTGSPPVAEPEEESATEESGAGSPTAPPEAMAEEPPAPDADTAADPVADSTTGSETTPDEIAGEIAAEPVEIEEPPPPPEPDPGVLVLSRAWSGATTVRIAEETYRMDGERRLELPPGEYNLRFSYRSGDYRDSRQLSIELEEGQTRRVSSPIPKPGRLTVQKGLQSPVGRVFLDGEEVGTFLRQRVTRPGGHQLRVVRESGDGAAIEETIEIEPDKHLVVTFDLNASRLAQHARDD